MTFDKEQHNRVLAQLIKPLVGLDPKAQGPVLAHLVSVYLAGFNPAIRDQAFDKWIDLVKELLPGTEALLTGGDPSAWRNQ
jgi:hypothetical protein